MATITNAIAGTTPLRLSGIRNWVIHAVLVASTVLLPMVAHVLGWPVLVLLPMFWGVVLAGMVYGWQGGILAAISAPLLNTVITGMPALPILPAMMVELAAYGIIPSLLIREDSKLPAPIALLAALMVGRGLLLLIWSTTVGSIAGLEQFAMTRLVPGIPAQLLQIVLVPVLAEAVKERLRPGAR